MLCSISKGSQITIPSGLRHKYGLIIGSVVDVDDNDKSIMITPIDNNILPFEELFTLADKTKRHNLTPKQIKAMDKDIYG